MKATELRIGNLVTSKTWKGVHKVSGSILNDENHYTIFVNGHGHIMDDGQYCELDSVSITEEWLLKLGFEAIQENGFDFVLKISAAKLYARRNADAWFFQFNETYLGQLFTGVHHIQNFYAAFGKELEVQP